MALSIRGKSPMHCRRRWGETKPGVKQGGGPNFKMGKKTGYNEAKKFGSKKEK